jgi:iron(III) transport system permease protein
MGPLMLRYRLARRLAWAAFILVAYSPLAGAVLGAVGEPALSVLDLFSERRLSLLVRSLAFSGAVATSVMLVGILAAIGLLRRWPAAAPRWQWLMLASLALPPTVPALAWTGIIALLHRTLPAGTLGIWWPAGLAQAMTLLPLATGMSLLALRTTDPQLLDAARMSASPAKLLLRVALPLARPTLISGLALIFLLSLLDYTLPSIFGVNVYAMEIFVAFSASHRVAEALWLSAPLAACALGLLATLAELPGRLAQASHCGFPRDGQLHALWRCVLTVAVLLAGLALAAPLLSVLPVFADLRYLGRTVAASQHELAFTLWTSGSAAALALLLAVGPAIDLAFGSRAAGRSWAFGLLPFLVPPALTGIGLIALWSPVHLIGMYGSAGMVVAAELARFTPVALVVLATGLLRIDPALIESALVGCTSMWQAVSRVMLPLFLPALGAACGLCFALSLGDIGAVLLVAPPGSGTLSMKTYNYLHYGGSPAAGGLCLMLAGLAAMGAAIPALWTRRKATQP